MTTIARALFDEMRMAPNVRGLVQIRKAFSLGSTRGASPWETRTRLLAELDAGIAGLGVNIPIFDLNGQLLGITDLLDHEAGLVIKSDGGDHHRENQRHTDDNRREEALERVGLVVSLAARRDALATNKREWTTDKPD